MNTSKNAQKKLFCYHYLKTLNPKWATKMAGLKEPPDSAWITLLCDPEVLREIKKLKERAGEGWNAATAALRLAELAFGRANDAVRLLFLNESDAGEIENMDLSLLLEAKRGKDGAFEVKLIDRMKAICELLSVCGSPAGEPASALFSAMERAAERVLAHGEGECYAGDS